MLTGQAKTEYQREYMRKRRMSQKDVRPLLDPVRPIQKFSIAIPHIEHEEYYKKNVLTEPIRFDADGNEIPEV